jgi:hypothetical protein
MAKISETIRFIAPLAAVGAAIATVWKRLQPGEPIVLIASLLVLMAMCVWWMIDRVREQRRLTAEHDSARTEKSQAESVGTRKLDSAKDDAQSVFRAFGMTLHGREVHCAKAGIFVDDESVRASFRRLTDGASDFVAERDPGAVVTNDGIFSKRGE